MAIYSKDSLLSDALMQHPSLIPVVGRLGVKLGVGDKTITETCREHGLDVTFFLSIINTYINEEYFPLDADNTFSLEKTIDYLEKTGAYYLKVQLPNIETHFNRLLQRSEGPNNLDYLKNFFSEMKNQWEKYLIYERETVYPGLRKGNFSEIPRQKILDENLEIEEKLQDLLTFFIVHLKGNVDSNLCMAVVATIFSLKTDISQNNRIRSRILVPIIEKIV